MHKVMIVDDEENVLHSLRRMLHKNKNLDVVTCTDPYEALKIANDSIFHLFLSDYRMPGMNGVEFLVRTKQFNPHAMRLILSGTADLEAMINAVNQAEIYRFIAKPAQEYELSTTLKRALKFFDLIEENRLLADQVRRQQHELTRRETALRRFSEKHPLIAEVNWGPNGEILLEDDDL